MRFSKRVAGAMTAIALAALAGTAQASTVTVGSPLTATFGPAEILGNGTLANLGLSEPGANATSPVSGAVVRWSVLGAEGPFVVRVLRPAGGTSYSAVGSSTIGVPANLAKQTFNTNLPIKAGDTIGLDVFVGSEVAVASTGPGSLFAGWEPAIADGETRAYKAAASGSEIAFNAEVQPQPSVALIGPASGSFAGGTAVTITGAEFAGVSAVRFGATPATSFAVGSESQITAVAPPGAVGATDITVTTVAGTSPVSAGARFEYTACLVPKLKGKKLKGAKKRLRAAGCKPGNVRRKKGVTAKKGKVVRQGVKAGKQLAPGAKVGLTLG
jgi:hypothetical protein